MTLRNATLVLALLAATTPAALAEDPPASAEAVTVEAFSPFEADLRMIQSGEHTASFVGSLAGTFYLDAGQGPVANGDLACVGMFEISLADGSQSGSGTCTFSADDGALAFGSWTCSGYHMVGCQGPFTVNGGTGRLAGISGKGPATIRSNFHAVAETAGGQVVQATEGILFWKKLELTLPAAAPVP
jgi:hypothetical protein